MILLFLLLVIFFDKPVHSIQRSNMNISKKIKKDNVMKWSWNIPQVSLEDGAWVMDNEGGYPISYRVSLLVYMSNDIWETFLKEEHNVANERVYRHRSPRLWTIDFLGCYSWSGLLLTCPLASSRLPFLSWHWWCFRFIMTSCRFNISSVLGIGVVSFVGKNNF